MNICTNCNHDLVNVVYGYPTPRLIDMARKEGVALGGMLKGSARPTHYCYGCHEAFGEDQKVISISQTLFSD